MPKIFIINGADKGRSFDLKGSLTYVGRALENDIRLNDRSISRKRLLVFRKADKYLVKDLKTTNGTFVQGRWIRERDRSDRGEPVAIGNIFFPWARPIRAMTGPFRS